MNCQAGLEGPNSNLDYLILFNQFCELNNERNPIKGKTTNIWELGRD